MSDTVRVWLVERTYDDRGLITLVYATTDGEREFRTQQAAQTIAMGGDVTAARDVDPDRLVSVDEADRERYADEASEMAERHDPADPV